MLNPGLPCSLADEDSFGPAVNASCHNGFDFTLLFEETVLTLLPLSLLLIFLPYRIWRLHQLAERVNRSWLYAMKKVW